jgi:hypothetical protein
MGTTGEMGTMGVQGTQGEKGEQGEQGEPGEKGAPGSHVRWVDGTGTEIPRFAVITSIPGFPAPLGAGVLFDANNVMWQVAIDPATLAASAAAFPIPTFIRSYTGADCTGDVVLEYTGQPKNVAFTLTSDTTIRRFPATAATSIPIQSQFFITQCNNVSTNVTGYLATATVPATALTPPTLTWSGPIEARWVD